MNNKLGHYLKEIKGNKSKSNTNPNENFRIVINKNKRVVINEESLKYNTEHILIKLSELFNIDKENLKTIYFKCSGDINQIIAYVNGEINLFDLWGNLEDEFVLSEDLEQLDLIITKRGFNEVMKRRLFLKSFDNLFKNKDFL